MVKLEENHLYKNSTYAPDWCGATKLDNWKINEIVNKSRTYDEASNQCEYLLMVGQLEEFDTIIREKLQDYFNPNSKTYGELRKDLK
jgi:hypothetical protein